MKATGFSSAKATLAKLPSAIQEEFDGANRDNAKLLVDMAKVLIPERTGASRLAIRNTEVADGAQLVDFGPKAKLIEGERGPRPFVNPALKLTRKKRRLRNNKALRQAVKKVS